MKRRFAMVVGSALCAATALAGCGSSEESAPPTSSPSASAGAALTLSAACSQVDSLMGSVTEDPSAEQAVALAEQLKQISSAAPPEVQQQIEDLGAALVLAANAPDGFAEGSPTEERFVLAAQELTVECEPEAPDEDPSRPVRVDPDDPAPAVPNP